MCLGKKFETPNYQVAYELHGFRRVGFYGLIQIICTLIGILIIVLGNYLFNLQFIYQIIIGAAIIIFSNIIPNGKPFIFNIYKMGREYIMFDASKREIWLISTKCGGFKQKRKLICSYSQFRGIAVHYETRQMLFLCKREESLLLKHTGDVLPNNHKHIQNILEDISLFWFTTINDENNCFFGLTYIPFEDGIVAEGNVCINTEYDYYLKNKRHKLYVSDNENDQGVYLKKNEIERFNSIEGDCINGASDGEEGPIVVDYV